MTTSGAREGRRPALQRDWAALGLWSSVVAMGVLVDAGATNANSVIAWVMEGVACALFLYLLIADLRAPSDAADAEPMGEPDDDEDEDEEDDLEEEPDLTTLHPAVEIEKTGQS